jgi:hypothetical protein
MYLTIKMRAYHFVLTSLEVLSIYLLSYKCIDHKCLIFKNFLLNTNFSEILVFRVRMYYIRLMLCKHVNKIYSIYNKNTSLP